MRTGFNPLVRIAGTASQLSRPPRGSSMHSETRALKRLATARQRANNSDCAMPELSPTESRKPIGDPPSSVWYQCQRCGNCCRWPGFVRLNDADITAISNFLGMDERVFIDRYTRLRPRRDGLALIDKPNGECVFLDGIDCTIQPVKPHQCSGFPNAWNFPGWRDVCEAIEVRT